MEEFGKAFLFAVPYIFVAMAAICAKMDIYPEAYLFMLWAIFSKIPERWEK